MAVTQNEQQYAGLLTFEYEDAAGHSIEPRVDRVDLHGAKASARFT